jgi:hypothetical protein
VAAPYELFSGSNNRCFFQYYNSDRLHIRTKTMEIA